MTEEKPRIALACPSFSGGGAERVMVTLANKFSEWGYPVDFIVGLDKGPYKEMLNPLINKVVLSDGGVSRLRKIVQASKNLRTYLNETNSMIVMSTIRDFNVFVSLICLTSKRRVNVYLREADTLDRLFVRSNLRNRVLHFLMKVMYRNSTGLLANCNVTKKDMIERCKINPSEVKVVYNPVSLKTFKPHKELVSKKLAGRVDLIACGRLDNKKNFKDAIKSVALVKKYYPEVRLKILGEGKERENLCALISELNLQDNVELLGFVDSPEKYYSSADVFIQTSLWEGFGYVLVEAMACGTPVVAYDSKGAMREILENGKYGKLTPVGDIEALSKAVIEQIENPTHPELLEEAVQRFDVNVIAKQYLQALGVEHV